MQASVRRRAWTTSSLGATMLVLMVAMVGLLAWESTIDEQGGGAVLDIEFEDDASSGLRIVGGSLFAAPLRGQEGEPVDPGAARAVTVSARRGDTVRAPGSRVGAPPVRGTGGDASTGGGGSTGGGTRTPAPADPTPTAPRPRTTTPVTNTTTTVPPADPLPVADPLPDPDPVAPLPTVDPTPIASVDTSEPTVEAGPVAGVSAGIDAGGVDASAPLVGGVSLNPG